MTEDEKVFGKGVWVHCNQHGRAHLTGWCTVSPSEKTKLDTAGTHAEAQRAAQDECRQKGLWLYADTKRT